MSEYRFEYKCSCLEESGVKLKFSLFQDYEKPSSPIKIQVAIPQEMQKDLKEVRLYFRHGGIKIPDIKNPGVKPEKKTKEEIEKDNAIYIQGSAPGEITGTGLIIFIRDDSKDLEPKPRDTYHFFVNFGPKATIYYQLEEKKKHLICKVVYPRLFRPVNLNVYGVFQRRPLLVKDFVDENKIRDTNNDLICITLPGGEGNTKSVSYIKRRIPVDKTDGFDFRLGFEDPKLEDYYLLVDESETTLEEKNKGNKTITKNKKARCKPITIKTCPFCGGFLRKSNNRFQSCDAYDDYIPPEDIQCLEFSKLTSGIICENIKEINNDVEGPYVFSKDFLKLPVMHTIFAGSRGSGKTILLANLLNITGTREKSDSDPHILTKIVQNYDKPRKGLIPIAKEEPFGTIKPSFVDADGKTKFRFIYEREGKALTNRSRYLFNVNQKIESSTPYTSDDAISYNPFIYRMGNLGYTIFYDVSGEAFEKRDEEPPRSFSMMDSIVAIVDGNPIKKGDNPLILLKECLENLVDRSNKANASVYDFPIAVVFTKIDEHLLETSNLDPNNCFDDDCHVARLNTYEIMCGKKRYKNSPVERHIENCSYELEHYIRSFESGELKFKDTIKNFNHIRFFACSALGNEDVLEKRGAELFVNHRSSSIGLELPIIWLMYQRHLIKR